MGDLGAIRNCDPNATQLWSILIKDILDNLKQEFESFAQQNSDIVKQCEELKNYIQAKGFEFAKKEVGNSFHWATKFLYGTLVFVGWNLGVLVAPVALTVALTGTVGLFSALLISSLVTGVGMGAIAAVNETAQDAVLKSRLEKLAEEYNQPAQDLDSIQETLEAIQEDLTHVQAQIRSGLTTLDAAQTALGGDLNFDEPTKTSIQNALQAIETSIEPLIKSSIRLEKAARNITFADKPREAEGGCIIF